MIFKVLKYLRSLLRIILLKIIYKGSFKIKFCNIKSLYIGKGVTIKINKGHILSFDHNIYVSDYCKFECIEGDIYVGKNTFFNTNDKIVSLKRISIGANCLFGPNLGIFDHNHRYDIDNVPINCQGYKTDEIKIGNNIWVGCNCTITCGVNICDNVVIAANSVVVKDIIKSGVYGGLPSKFIKSYKN